MGGAVLTKLSSKDCVPSWKKGDHHCASVSNECEIREVRETDPESECLHTYNMICLKER